MSGFTHSLLRVPFLALIVRNVLAPTLTMDWKHAREAAAGACSFGGWCFRRQWRVALLAAGVVCLPLVFR